MHIKVSFLWNKDGRYKALTKILLANEQHEYLDSSNFILVNDVYTINKTFTMSKSISICTVNTLIHKNMNCSSSHWHSISAWEVDVLFQSVKTSNNKLSKKRTNSDHLLVSEQRVL